MSCPPFSLLLLPLSILLYDPDTLGQLFKYCSICSVAKVTSDTLAYIGENKFTDRLGHALSYDLVESEGQNATTNTLHVSYYHILQVTFLFIALMFH